MESTEVKTVPANVAYCRGTRCDKQGACGDAGSCLYKSSSDEFREALGQLAVPFVDVPATPKVQVSREYFCGTCKSESYNPDCGVCRSLPGFTANPWYETKVEAWARPADGDNMKPSNPKDMLGSKKLPLRLFPLSAIALGCLAFLEGMLKYGLSNFRVVGVRSSIYYDAARRHLDSWWEGEDIDPDSGIEHLGKALACIAVLIDAKAAGKLRDDRTVKGNYSALVRDLTPHVGKMMERHKDKSPRHYTIQDNELADEQAS